MTSPAGQAQDPPARPVDVDTGFWLWLVALPLMVVGYVADLFGSSNGRGATPLLIGSGLFTGALCAIVVTFLILMRAGYRWARTTLTGGAIATVVYVGIRLFTVTWPPVWAVACGAAGITGSVLIAGGNVPAAPQRLARLLHQVSGDNDPDMSTAGQAGMMEDVTAGTDTEAKPIFREVGATWYWLLAGPIAAGIMLWIEKSNGNGWQISIPAFFLVVMSAFIALQIKAARIHTSVVLTPQTLRQGTETIKISDILKVFPEPDSPSAAKKDVERWQSARALGELVGVPKGRTGIGLKLTGGRTAQAWARRHRHLRNLLTPLVEERVGPNKARRTTMTMSSQAGDGPISRCRRTAAGLHRGCGLLRPSWSAVRSTVAVAPVAQGQAGDHVGRL